MEGILSESLDDSILVVLGRGDGGENESNETMQ